MDGPEVVNNGGVVIGGVVEGRGLKVVMDGREVVNNGRVVVG